MLRRVESLSPLVFPNEVRKQNPVVKIKDGRFRVKYPSLEGTLGPVTLQGHNINSN